MISGYKNPVLPVSERVKDLLDRMTIEEKVAQMLCIWMEKEVLIFDTAGKFDLTRLKSRLKDSVGQIGRLSDARGGLTAREMAETANKLQKYFTTETRLGIPVIFHEECLHGLAAREATSYPQPIGMAAAFNPALVEEVYTAIAGDTR